jgi:hypothetical protein
MKKSLLLMVFFATPWLSFSAFGETIHIDWKSCPKIISKMKSRGERVHAQNIRNRVGHSAANAPFLLKVAVDFPRDLIRRALQLRNKDPYPYVQRNDLPLAVAFGKSAFVGRLSDDQKKLINLDSIREDLDKTLAEIEAYPMQLRTLIDQASNAEIERIALQRAKKLVSTKHQGITIEMPYYKNGVLQETVRVEYYGNKIIMGLESKNPSVFFTFPRPGYTVEMNNISRALKELESKQAANTQKIEIYAHELRRQASYDAKESFNDEYFAKFLERADSFYESGQVDGTLKNEFIPPYEAWTKWHWQAFFRQLFKDKSLSEIKDAAKDPRIAKSESVTNDSSLWRLIESFSPSDHRAVGLDKYVESKKALMRSAWVRVFFKVSGYGLKLAGLGAAGWGIGELNEDDYGRNFFVGLTKEILADHFRRQKCIETVGKNPAESDALYKACVEDYLSLKYPKQYIMDIMSWDELVLRGEVSDPKIREDLKNIRLERRAFLQNLAAKSMMSKAVDVALDDPADPLSPQFRKELVKEEDESLVVMRLTSPTPGRGYLATRHPYAIQIPEIHALIVEAVQNREDPVAFKIIIAHLKDYRFGAEVADDLVKFLSDREAHKTAKAHTSEIDKKIEEAIRTARGIDSDSVEPENLER